MNFQIIKKNKGVVKGSYIIPKDYSQGFMYIKFWPHDVGMLFNYYEPTKMSFWMKNVIIPLEIAFIDKDVIIDIKQMIPGSEELIKPTSDVLCTSALEMPLDWFSKNEISIGDKITNV